jgi:hypothetical protein
MLPTEYCLIPVDIPDRQEIFANKRFIGCSRLRHLLFVEMVFFPDV